ncbi:amino acid synthesis family protein [Phreatobacter aquaticus]|uniref:Amino acid synthesis family protein n=1 Tax=Phreatobacter aquaticus TaxID=2570229 RepID=A0A4D7QKJ7_9HYPH|nr:amino acid synthesis family protein [Phreatobacter aquaticus]QCK86513.1 amino acid synthesis family protein [Phreatobacter aquaticus]
MNVDVRKIVVGVEDVRHDGGPKLDKPILKGFVAAIVKNPFAGRYVEDIQGMMDALKPLGLECSTTLLKAMGGDPKSIEGYGKGSVVGTAGELEHGALWHVPGGYAMRELLGQALSIVPSMTKIGTVGTILDIPLHHKDAAYVRSHFDGITAFVADSPRPDEIMFTLAMATGGRPHPRMGGLTQDQISKWDGQR